MSKLVLFVAVLAWCVSPVMGEVFLVDRDNGNDSAGAAAPGEWHHNEGAGSTVRIKASDHQWYGDWDTEAILDYMDANPCPPGYYYQATLYIVPDANEGGWVGVPQPIEVAAVWSENDWVEGDDAARFPNYGWTNPTVNHAATHVYAQDIEDPNNPGNSDPARVVNWMHPVNGACTFLGTFVDHSDNTGMFGGDWQPWLNVVNSIANSVPLWVDPATDIGNYVGVVLDDALLCDLLYNHNNRGLVLYDLPPDTFANRNIRTDDYANSEPYLDIVCVPEPATMLLLLGGGAFLALRRKS